MKQKEVCKVSGYNAFEHIVDVNKSYKMPNGGRMNGDVDEITDEIFDEVKAFTQFRAEQKRQEKGGI